MKKYLCLLITCLFAVLFSMTAFASEETLTDIPNYDETNSFQFTVKTAEKTNFTPEDFPEVSCTDS